MSGSGESAAQKILHRLRIPWPDADEGKLRQAAVQWRRLAMIIDDAASMTNREALSLTAADYGPAIKAFEKHWQKYGEKGAGQMARMSEACNKMAKACDDYAKKVEETKHRIEMAAIEVGATLVIGAVGAVITFGASEAAAASIASALSATVLSEFGALGAAAATIAGNILAWSLYGAFNTALTEGALNSIKAALGEKLPGGKAEAEKLLRGIRDGITTGGLSKGAAAGASQLAKPFEQAAATLKSTDPELSNALEGISKALTDSGASKIVQGVSSTAANQAITEQEYDAKGLASSAVKNSIKQAIGKSVDG
jgi:hypothetical protein